MKTERGSFISTVKKRLYLFKRCHVEIISPSSKKKYSISFQTFVWEIFSPMSPMTDDFHRAAGETVACPHLPPHWEKTWEIYLNVLSYSPASENPQTKLTPSLHQLTCPGRLNSSPDYESTGFLLWKFDETIHIFFPLHKKEKPMEKNDHTSVSYYWLLKQWFIRSKHEGEGWWCLCYRCYDWPLHVS